MLETVPGMTGHRLLPLVAAALLLGACAATPQPAAPPKVATLASAGPSAKPTTAAATATGKGIRLRLDSTEDEQIKLVENYQECLFQNGVKEVADDGRPRPAGKTKRLLDESGEPKSAYAACAGKKPLPPAELDENANPNFAAQWEDNVRCLRVERARRLLHHTRLPLAEIADQVGYSDQSHMTRDFRRAFDQSPAAYRRLVRGH